MSAGGVDHPKCCACRPLLEQELAEARKELEFSKINQQETHSLYVKYTNKATELESRLTQLTKAVENGYRTMDLALKDTHNTFCAESRANLEGAIRTLILALNRKQETWKYYPYAKPGTESMRD